MDKFNVYVPKLLPKEESFVTGRRSCSGCGKAMALRFVSKALGREAVFKSDDSKGMVFERPDSPSFGWDEMTFDDLVQSVISGIGRGNKKLISEGKTNREWVKKPAIALDRKILEGNYTAFSNLLERKLNILIALYDNEPYMDRFIKDSIPPAFGIEYEHHTPGEKELKFIMEDKSLIKPLIESNIPYAASASVAYPFDLIEKIKKGMERKGTALVLIHSPCPTGWIFPAQDTVKLAKLAIDSRFFPLWELSDGKLSITLKVESSEKIEQYIKSQDRYRNIKSEVIPLIRKSVDREYIRLLDLEKRNK